MQVTPHGGLANRCTRPLCDLSVGDGGRNPIMGIGGPSPWPTRPTSTSQPPTTWAERWPGTIGEPSRADGQILIADYDPAWPALYEREAARIRSLLGDRVRLLEHAGSTSVPGTRSQADHRHGAGGARLGRRAGVCPGPRSRRLRPAGREPDWFEHRLFKGTGPRRQPARLLRGIARDRPDARLPRPPADATRTIAGCIRPPSASWRPATGSTSRTTPMPRTRSSRRSSRGPWPSGPRPTADRPARVDIERASRYRPGTHMSHHFYFRCPA